MKYNISEFTHWLKHVWS